VNDEIELSLEHFCVCNRLMSGRELLCHFK